MTINELVKGLAEEFRDEAERLEVESVGECFKIYKYDAKDVRELIDDYLLPLDVSEEYDDHGAEVIYTNGESITRREFIKRLRAYKF